MSFQNQKAEADLLHVNCKREIRGLCLIIVDVKVTKRGPYLTFIQLVVHILES